MSLRDAALALRIGATVPYVWLRVRLLPLPRALAGLMPGARYARSARCAVRGAQWKQGKECPGTGNPAVPAAHRALRTAHGSVATSRAPRTAHRARERSEQIVRLTDLILERRWALLRSSCLLRSLVLFRFLREAGLPVQINFGVAREDEALKGHSWLTLDDIPYAEPQDPTARFQVVYTYPPL